MTDTLALLDSLPVAAFATDAEGWLVRYNSAAARLWGQAPAVGTVRWTGALRLLDPEGRALGPQESPAARTHAAGRPAGGPLLVERPDGSRVPVLARPSLLHDAEGGVCGVLELLLEPAAVPAPEASPEAPPETPDGAELAAARLAAIVSSSDDAIVGKSLDGRVTSWNEGAVRIFGWSAAEMIGQPITKIIPPELYPEETAILARLRRGERIAHFDTERVSRDGRRLAVSLTVSPIRDAAGRVVGASKIARDVTARKAAEATQRRLVEELNHRVKNTLAMIQAIAGQSLRHAASPEAFVARFAARVRALARVHDLLAAGAMAGVEITALLDAELTAEPAGGVEGGAAAPRLQGPEVLLEPRVAVQLALVLHELADNARRHGALAVPGGRLAVDWRLAPAAGSTQLQLDWHEGWPDQGRAERPRSAAPAAGGFGISLIERSLQAQGGSAQHRRGPGEIAWTIRLPLPDLVRPVPAAPPAASAAAPPAPAALLAGRQVLVVEDEPLIALEIETELSAAGAIVIGPVGTLEAAARLIAETRLDAALLDANLAGRPVDTLAAALAARGVPFAFASGYGRMGLPEGFRDRPLLGKPFGSDALGETLLGLLAPSAESRAESETAEVIPLRKRD